MRPSVTLEIDTELLETWAVYALFPALVGTVVYWYFTDATAVETAIFAVVMVVMILAMDHVFDTMPGE